ncbi:MAG: beta-galactosidase [Brevinema sp.]
MKEFPFGASYYPIFQQDMDKGLSILKNTGINFIRTAEIFNSWDTIEKSPNNYDISFLDELFDKCKNYDIKILLGTGTSCPPYWLARDHQVNIVDQNNQMFPNDSMYSWACMNNPHYLESAERYILKLVTTYKDHSQLFAYQLHNEIGYPFMPNTSGQLGVYCYCKHCTKKFQLWLKQKYQTLDKLQEAYRWSATNSQYNSWEEITFPRVKPANWSSITRWIDFRLFSMEVIVNFLHWQVDLIKSLDKEHRCSTNIFFQKGQDPMGTLLAIDQFKIAETVDIVGYDLYPGSGNKMDKRPYYCSMFLDHGRSISHHNLQPFWLLETEGGPINGWMAGPERNTSPSDLEHYLLEAIGHDVKLSLYQLFTEPEYQPLHWGGVVSIDGEETIRTPIVRKLGIFLKQQSEFILNSKALKSEVAILLDKENMIAISGVDNEKLYLDCLNSCYSMLWGMGLQIDFISVEQLKHKEIMNQYHTVFTPFTVLITKEVAALLAEYTKNGGILVGTPRMGVIGEKGWFNLNYPAFVLQDVFGLKVTAANSQVTPNVGWNRKNYKGYWHLEEIILDSNTIVEAWDSSDMPIIIKNQYGKGLGVYFTTHADAAYLKENSFLMWDYLENLWRDRGIYQSIQYHYSGRKNREIDPHVLIHHDKKTAWIIVTNYTNNKDFYPSNGQKKVQINLNNFVTKIDRITEIYNKDGVPCVYHKTQNGFCIQTYISKKQARVLKIEGKFE